MRVKQINSAKDLEVYQLDYVLAMQIFEISKAWPDIRCPFAGSMLGSMMKNSESFILK